jgi:hypothetical protein
MLLYLLYKNIKKVGIRMRWMYTNSLYTSVVARKLFIRIRKSTIKFGTIVVLLSRDK